jgi:hypothetical protein
MDGAHVVALLSSGDDFDDVFCSVDEPASREELERLRKALFDEPIDGGTSAIAWDNALNFVPEFLQIPAAPGTQPGDDLTLHMGATDANEAWQAWIGQWSRVLTSYQDEVWGDLGGLVDEARTEVEQMQRAGPGENSREPKALLRLRAILGHLRGA